MTRTSLGPTVLLLAVTGCMPRHARPAELMLERTVTGAAGEGVGSAIGSGARLSADWLMLAASRADAVSHPNGRPCGGFVMDPAPCREQPLVQRDRVLRFAAGYRVDRDHDSVRLFIAPYAGLAILEQEQRGLMSGAVVDGTGGGPMFGLAGGLQYNLFGDFWLGALADAALILPWNAECDDCHLPYVDPIRTAGLAVTASWRLP